MAAKKYSAGAIFLQVVPVFADVQRAIEREAKNIDRALGDQMEKSGKEAGERAGRAASKSMGDELEKGSTKFERDFRKSVDQINDALSGINVRKFGNDVRKEVTAIKKEVASLKDADLTLDVDRRKVDVALAELEGRLQNLRDNSKVVLRADIDDALKGFRKIATAKEAIEDPVEIEVRADIKPAVREMGAFERGFKKTADKAAKHLSGSMNKEVRRIKDDLVGLQNLRIGVDISANQAHAELRELERELYAISRNDPDIAVRVEAAKAHAELFTVNRSLDRIDGRTVTAHVNSSSIRKAGHDADLSANSFRSFNIILLAAASAGPALVPVLAAIGGGLLAIGPAAAVASAGLASVLIGFSGIGDALGALQARDEQAAMGQQTLGRAAESAGRAQENAARGVADARRAAADAIEDALEQQRDAQEAYRDSIEEVKEAEEALRQARADARGQGADIKERISDNALAQDQALLDVFNATVDYNSIMADGSATNAEQEQARINLEQARDALADLRKEGRELAKEQREWRKEGVNGTDEVKDAQENLNTALEAQEDAYEALGEAAEAVDEARADGARAVRDAMRSQATAVDDAAAAMEGLTSQQNAVNNAFNKLGPAGIAFTRFLYGLRDEFYAFRDDIQAAMLPSIQQAIEGFIGSESGSAVRQMMIDLAEGFGRFTVALSKSFQGDVWLKFFRILGRLGPDIQAAYGRAFIKFMEGLASIMTVMAPYALDMAEAFAGWMESFADWAKSKRGQDQIRDFMDYVKRVAPDVVDFFKALGRFSIAFAIGLAGWGESVLHGMTNMLNAMADLDPKILSAVVTAVAILITSSQTAYAIMNLLMAGGALFGSTVGAWIFLIAGIGLAVYALYKQNEDFRDFIQDAWKRISESLKKAWEDDIKPALEDLMEAFQELWKEVLQPFFEWLGPIILDVAEVLIPLLARAFGTHIKIISFFIRRILVPALKAIGWTASWVWKTFVKPFLDNFEEGWKDTVNAVKAVWRATLRPTWLAVKDGAVWLWKKGIKPPIDSIEKGWRAMGKAMEWVWNNIIFPMMDFIGRKALPKLESAFKASVRAIKGIWDDLKRGVGTPIAFVIKTVLNNGIIAGFNKVAGWVNDDLKVGTIDMPNGLEQYAATGGIFGRRKQAFADGGVMPGYTPGRDVHRFISPTGGILHLSGGEPIMRPEFGAVVGHDWVDKVNAAARSGGVQGVRKALAGGASNSFFLGGVMPLVGGSGKRHEDGYGWVNWAGDLNSPYDLADPPSPVVAWKSGRVAHTYTGYGDSHGRYGNHIILNHGGQTSLYAHLSSIAVGVGQAVKAAQMIGRVGQTGNAYGAHLHFEVDGGSVDVDDMSGGGGKISKWGSHKKPPGWIIDIVKNPLGWAKDVVNKPIQAFKSKFQNSDMIDAIAGLPTKFIGGLKNKVMDTIPGWVKDGVGAVGKGLDKIGLGNDGNPGDGNSGDGGGSWYKGGIYNGVMKYDNGGYLPPGLTSVVNLTGHPEPVFTNEQWDKMQTGGGPGYHYEPHFEGSNLTAEDVAADMNFTFRRLRRGGKYAEVGQP